MNAKTVFTKYLPFFLPSFLSLHPFAVVHVCFNFVLQIHNHLFHLFSLPQQYVLFFWVEGRYSKDKILESCLRQRLSRCPARA